MATTSASDEREQNRETDPNDSGRDNGSSLTAISDGLVKPIEWTIEQLDLARLRARIVANIGSKLLLRRPILAKRVYQQEGGQLRYTLRKLSLQCSKSSLRSVYVTRTPAITGKSTNSEQSGSHPSFADHSVCSAREGAYIKTLVQDWSAGFEISVDRSSLVLIMK